MNPKIPDFLILSPDRLAIEFCPEARGGRTKRDIAITGPKVAFVTLANALLFFLGELQPRISLGRLPFVDCINLKDLVIDVNDLCDAVEGRIRQVSKKEFEWIISERNLVLVAGDIHMLGYATPHIHLDRNMKPEDISIYCELDSPEEWYGKRSTSKTKGG